MVLTKADLQDWNSNPVTKMIFKKISEELDVARTDSCMMPTADETALKTAYKEGFVEGANALLEAYETSLDEAE